MNDTEVMSKLGRKFQEALKDPELQVCMWGEGGLALLRGHCVGVGVGVGVGVV